MRADDLGKTWTEPVEIPELALQYEPDSTTVSVADVTPGWHEKTGKLLAIGIKVRYNHSDEITLATSSPPCLKPTRDCDLVEPSLVLFKVPII